MKTTGTDYASLTGVLIDLCKSILEKYSPLLLDLAVLKDRAQLPNNRHPGNFLSRMDLSVQGDFLGGFLKIFPSFVLASEEDDPQTYPKQTAGMPEHVVIIDPLDTSELAVRSLFGYTHVVVYSIKEQLPVISIVGDFFHYTQFFYAFRDSAGVDRAFLRTRDGRVFPLTTSQEATLGKALVTNYSLRPAERFAKLAEQRRFLELLGRADSTGQAEGRIGVDFGSVGLCHVAAGFTDAMVEFAKGFKLWDLLPGHHILNAAGGKLASLDGKPISLNLGIQDPASLQAVMETRRKFIAGGNSTLVNAILGSLVLSGNNP